MMLQKIIDFFSFHPRPLSGVRPENRSPIGIPLGMEATDLALIDRVNRQNQSLERTNGAEKLTGRVPAMARPEDAFTPFPQDETYARRYHAAYQSKD